ncbi:hypothetical protein H9L39_14772 [Fusarium oxysporum f. sp. albedinis]|nr:hypothetical protein H9L39_14772 [Fusarium oxysporum f. sp. albedinis]
MLPRSTFLPYVHTFFQRLYPVFPVIDKECLLTLLQSGEHPGQWLPTDLYSFLVALSTAVIVQLNVADLGNLEAQSSAFDDINNSPRSSPTFRPAVSAQFFVSQCMQARQQRGFIEEPDEWTIILPATPQCLEPHGIGMEQKVSDVASCLCDILAGLNTDQLSTDFSAPDVLNNFMVFLAGFRNHESQCLRPLVQKATTVLAARLHPSSFPTAAEDRMKNQEILGYKEDESVWTAV